MLNKLKENIYNKKFIDDFLLLTNNNRSAFPRIGLAPFEAFSLYTFIRTNKPKKIYEMSPDMGWSSFLMAEAILAEKYENEVIFFKSFDLENKIIATANDSVNKISNYSLITGDAMSNVNFEDENIDFWFIDSNHSYSFAQWYINLINKSDYIFIHDIDPAEDYHKKFRTNDSCIHAGGEPLVFYNYLKQKGYFISEKALLYDKWNSVSEIGTYHPYWSHENETQREKLFWNFTEQIDFNLINQEFVNGNNRSVFYYTK